MKEQDLDNTASARANDFLKSASQFNLGKLPTETPHSKTVQLSTLAQTDLVAGHRLLQEVDCDAIAAVVPAAQKLEGLRSAVAETLGNGGRIFLCGCGATGRLSLSLEVLWREQVGHDRLDGVVAFMAGGDLALVRSIENFEDHPEYGARQLEELGFSENDLLISTTEGGETPFVIGATERAVELSHRKPYFLYCNPDDILCEVAERSKRVIQSDKIQKINLTTGPMALSGSTRMQASTVLMLAVGVCLLPQNNLPVVTEILNFLAVIKNIDYSVLARITEQEAKVYKSKCYTVYRTSDYGMTILTDTTERSPTFSLKIFENTFDDNRKPALCYLNCESARDAIDAYVKILHREPRTLEWDETVSKIAGRERLRGYDFSRAGLEKREKLVGKGNISVMQIDRVDNKSMRWRFSDEVVLLKHRAANLLHENLLLKVLLNAHSTLIMGRIGRFEQNLMTYVKPSNKKLVDRAIRYVQILLGPTSRFSYEQIARQCFESAEKLVDDEPIVLRVVGDLKK